LSLIHILKSSIVRPNSPSLKLLKLAEQTAQATPQSANCNSTAAAKRKKRLAASLIEQQQTHGKITANQQLHRPGHDKLAPRLLRAFCHNAAETAKKHLPRNKSLLI